jgi:Na+/H+ antiporter NhaD/arsenite permease-like protein
MNRLLALPVLLLTVSGAARADAGATVHETVGLWLSIPFVLLLLSIAVVPFINRHWWERWYPAVAILLGAATAALYGLEGGRGGRILHTAQEYASFIILIGSLFVVAGGLHIRLRGKAQPIENVVFLGVGAILSNLVGTTGASMILIRPFLRANRYRIRPFHVVFFIFIVSNMGGALTPIGDPPLFLGYLRGIPFFWVLGSLWLPWLIGTGLVLGVFYLLDERAYRRLSPSARSHAEHAQDVWEITGAQNLLFLAAILGSVFIEDPAFLREGVMIGAAVLSYFTTPRAVHEKNEFNFLPIREVALLFLGIFATMMPALEWLEGHATELGVTAPGHFYWATGVLSSFLDNAPTYLNFLTAEIGLLVPPAAVAVITALIQAGAHAAAAQTPEVAATMDLLVRHHPEMLAARSASPDAVKIMYLLATHPVYIQAVSLAAVFFGACTYIGNGPNFMVKSIAEQSGVECPSFFGYVLRYTLPVLLPVFTLIWFLFFR